MPEQTAATTVHSGPFENFSLAHTALLTWIEANGFRVAGPYREVYIRHDADNMSETATEIQYPVERS